MFEHFFVVVECRYCKKYFDKSSIDSFTIFGNKQNFCSMDCKKLFVSKVKEIVTCDYCKVTTISSTINHKIAIKLCI